MDTQSFSAFITTHQSIATALSITAAIIVLAAVGRIIRMLVKPALIVTGILIGGGALSTWQPHTMNTIVKTLSGPAFEMIKPVLRATNLTTESTIGSIKK